MLVLGGLCTVPDILYKLGISRLGIDSTHQIGAFKRGSEGDNETNELIEAWRENFEIPEGPWQQEILQMAEESSHWPMHIHNSLRALAKEIVDNKGEMSHLNLIQVRENAAQMRMSYFNARISPELEKSKNLLATAMKKIPAYNDQESKIKIGDIVDKIWKTISNPPSKSPSWQLPDGIEDVHDYAKHLVQQGLIQTRKDRYYYCPIPTLKSYVLKHCCPSSN